MPLVFNGDTNKWVSEIITSKENLLLTLPGSDDCQSENPPDNIVRRHIGLFTSASTGDAKCIWNTYDKLLKNARISAGEFEIAKNDRLLMLAKPWHVAGLSWALMAEDLNLEYLFLPTQRGEEHRWYQAIREFNPNYLLTVPEVLRALFAFENWFVPNIIYGGTPIHDEDYGPLSVHASSLYQGYGQTEAGGLISCYKLSASKEKPPGSCFCYGPPPKEFEIRCEGTPANPQSIWLSSPTAIHDGFYDTGDEGFIKDGKIYLRGRQ